MKLRHMLEQAQIVRQILGEAESRVEHDTLKRNTSVDTHVPARAQELYDLARDVIVVGIVLHICRLAPHVHQTNRKT